MKNIQMISISTILAITSVGMYGCADEQNDQPHPSSESEVMPPTGDENSTADVKQKLGEATEEIKQQAESLTDEAKQASEAVAEKTQKTIESAQKTAKETASTINEKAQATKEKAKEAVNQVTTDVASGGQLYATCVGCHGSQGEGGVGPKLAGQSQSQLVDKMKRYKAGENIGPMSSMMIPNAQQLSLEEIQSVSKYITTL